MSTYLPAPCNQAGAPIHSGALDPKARAAVLIIDDEPAVRGMLARALQRKGFAVTTAENGRAGVEARTNFRFDVAITDLKMPGMDGMQTLVALKEIDPEIEVIVATGYATVETAIACMKHGAYDYVQKPLNLKEVDVLLNRALEKRQLKGMVSLYEWSRDLLAMRGRRELIRLVLDMTGRFLPIDTVGLVLNTRGGARPQVHRPAGPHAPPASFLKALARRAEPGRPLCFSSLELEPLLCQDGDDLHFCAVLVYPLAVRSKSLGALVLLRRAGQTPFTAAEVRRGTVFSSQVALAMDSARLYEELARKVKDLAAQGELLAEMEARTRAILETALDGIITMDEAGVIRDLNPAGRRIFNLSCRQAVGRKLSDLMDAGRCPEADGLILERFFRSCEAPALGQRFELVTTRHGGDEIRIELSITAIEVPRGRIFSAFVRDISEQSFLEMQLRQAQKLESLGQLAAGIAHEINTPTQYVGDNTRFLQDVFHDLLGLVETFQRCAEAAGEGRPIPAELAGEVRAAAKQADVDYLLKEIPHAIEQSIEGVGRIAKIVRAMKVFSHPGAEGQKTPIDINQAIESTITIARHEWKYVANMAVDLDPELPLVPCLPSDFNQAILNIIVNAAHAIAESRDRSDKGKGTITVSTRLADDWAEIRITDTGKGIPESIRTRIFDPFFTTKEIGKGTGQGLTLVHAIVVKKHGGSISVDSRVGNGTTFLLRLPLIDSVDGSPSVERG